jgi:hypothetical protein
LLIVSPIYVRQTTGEVTLGLYDTNNRTILPFQWFF